MTAVRLAIDAYRRIRAGQPEIILSNRFFERNPTNLNEGTALVIRPAHRYRTAVGAGPIRQIASSQGCFNNDAFVVSGSELYRVAKNAGAADTVTQIPGFVDGITADDNPEICIRTDAVFIADGFTLKQTNGVAALASVVVPDGLGVVSLDIINGYIILVIANSQRCYWINPGELTIDPLNFFEAERAPDWVHQVRTVGDQFWLLGYEVTEVWRHTGAALAPFQRIEGRLFDRGIWGGTAVRIKDSVVVVGNDGRVYNVVGAPEPISNPGIAEIIRDAIGLEG